MRAFAVYAFACLIIGTSSSLSWSDSDEHQKLSSYKQDNLDRALVQAILSGHATDFRVALQGGANPNTVIYINYENAQAKLSALSVAVLLRRLDMIRSLRNAGSRDTQACEISLFLYSEPLNTIVPKNSTRATLANVMEAQKEAKCYLRIGDYNIDPTDEQSELLRAIVDHSNSDVKKLLAAGVSLDTRERGVPTGTTPLSVKWPGRSALHIAILERRSDYIDLLINAGADVNSKASLTSRWGGWDGFTPLMLAVGLEFSDAVTKLIKAKADLSAVDESGLQALYYCVLTNSAENFNVLLNALSSAQKKLALSSADRDGRDLLTAAISSTDNALFKDIIGAMISSLGKTHYLELARTAIFETAVHREYKTLSADARELSRARKTSAMLAIIQSGVSVDVTNDDGKTLLMALLNSTSDLRQIQSLARLKPNLSLRDKYGRNLIYYIERRADKKQIRKFLLNAA